MNRRKFSKMLSIGVASLTVPILMGGCDKQELLSLNTQNSINLKEVIDNYLVQADCTDYEQCKNVFRQNRCILITDDYKIIFDSLLLKKFKADAIVQIQAKGMVKCNFDIYKSNFQIVSKVRKNEYLEIMKTNISGQLIKYFDWGKEKILNYPIKANSSVINENVCLNKNYSLPCIMTKETFNGLMRGYYDY